MHRILGFPAALAAAGLVAAAASAGTHYTDPSGDSGAAPDVVAVDVSNDAAGDVTFVTTMAPRPSFASDESVDVFVNTDGNRATGSTQSGSELVLDFTTAGWGLYRWDGSRFGQATSHGAIDVSSSLTAEAFTIRATLDRADLDATRAFSFFVETAKGAGAATDPFDAAPDGAAVFTYTLELPATVRSVGATVPAAAHPGRTLRLSGFHLTLSDGTIARPDRVACRATVADRRLAPAGTCSFVVPRTAAGRSVLVTVSLRYDGRAYTRRYTIRVARR